MLEIKFIRENPEIVKKDLQKRGDKEKFAWVDRILELDEEWRTLKGQADDMRSRRNKLSLEINKIMKEKGDASAIIKEAKDIPPKIEAIDKKVEDIQTKVKEYLMRLPNILHESVPQGKDDEENVEVETFGEKPTFGFEPRSHVDIIEEKGFVDLERASKISGSRWYFLKGDLAILEMALTRYAIDFMGKKGYTLVVPPHMINRKAYEGVTSLDDFEEVIYKIENEDLYMIATSEHPLTAMYMDEILDEKQLPIKLIGFSTNFRKEVGSHGKDTKGIFRVHQFNKVEQIIISNQEDSWKLHEELIKNAEEFFKSLGLHFRKVNICTGDIGIVAAKKYDLEVWMPVQQKYREVVSCSNCTAYQSVRLNMRYPTKEGNRYCHTLNSTCVATSRALVAIIENFQEKDRKIKIPDVLVPYMNGKKYLG